MFVSEFRGEVERVLTPVARMQIAMMQKEEAEAQKQRMLAKIGEMLLEQQQNAAVSLPASDDESEQGAAYHQANAPSIESIELQ